jgi:hypothetical protein
MTLDKLCDFFVDWLKQFGFVVGQSDVYPRSESFRIDFGYRSYLTLLVMESKVLVLREEICTPTILTLILRSYLEDPQLFDMLEAVLKPELSQHEWRATN